MMRAAFLLLLMVPTAGLAQSVQFKRDLVPVLRQRCAACHLTGKEPGKIALHPGAAYANLVNVAATETKFLRVRPGKPNESYLMMKLDGTHLDRGGTGARMPLGQAPLDVAMRDKFRAWIAAGAKDD